jgi:hypothetical protein
MAGILRTLLNNAGITTENAENGLYFNATMMKRLASLRGTSFVVAHPAFAGRPVCTCYDAPIDRKCLFAGTVLAGKLTVLTLKREDMQRKTETCWTGNCSVGIVAAGLYPFLADFFPRIDADRKWMQYGRSHGIPRPASGLVLDLTDDMPTDTKRARSASTAEEGKERPKKKKARVDAFDMRNLVPMDIDPVYAPSHS